MRAMSKGFSLNACEPCMLKAANVSQLKGNGDIIWDSMRDTPKNAYFDLEELSLSPEKEVLLQQRAREGKTAVLTLSKERYRFINNRFFDIENVFCLGVILYEVINVKYEQHRTELLLVHEYSNHIYYYDFDLELLGGYVSWGFGAVFDEYFGGLNAYVITCM